MRKCLLINICMMCKICPKCEVMFDIATSMSIMSIMQLAPVGRPITRRRKRSTTYEHRNTARDTQICMQSSRLVMLAKEASGAVIHLHAVVQ
jgi:hypothetical protein